MSMISSSHSPVSETTFEYNSLPKTLPCDNFIFVCRLLRISLEKLFFSVSSNCSGDSFYVGVHPFSPFFVVLLTGLHLVIDSFNLHHAVIL